MVFTATQKISNVLKRCKTVETITAQANLAEFMLQFVVDHCGIIPGRYIDELYEFDKPTHCFMARYRRVNVIVALNIFREKQSIFACHRRYYITLQDGTHEHVPMVIHPWRIDGLLRYNRMQKFTLFITGKRPSMYVGTGKNRKKVVHEGACPEETPSVAPSLVVM
jgi:hypothetical protein